MSEKKIIPDEVVISKIYLIRNQKVMLDSDISELYGVETKALNQQVKRNITRFPLDFSFQLTNEEWKNLRSQNVTSSWGGRRSEKQRIAKCDTFYTAFYSIKLFN